MGGHETKRRVGAPLGLTHLRSIHIIGRHVRVMYARAMHVRQGMQGYNVCKEG
jgi:hypothetical protein